MRNKNKTPLILFFILGLVASFYAKEIRQAFDAFVRAVAPNLFQVVQRYSGQQSTAELQDALDASGQRISQKLMGMQPIKHNYYKLRHMIGIEKWGQSRLRVALGEPFVMEEYNGHLPPIGLSWNELQDLFAETRAQTIAIASEIQLNDSYHSYRILHNQFGELPVDGWLTYLRVHADGEFMQMR